MDTLQAVLIDASLKSLAVLLLAIVLVAIMRRASAAARHLAWTVAVAAALLMPAITWLLPGWAIVPVRSTIQSQTPSPPQPIAQPQQPDAAPPHDRSAFPGALRPAAKPMEPQSHDEQPWASQTLADEADDALPYLAPADLPSSAAQAAPSTIDAVPQDERWAPAVVLTWVWLIGGTLALLPLVLGWISLWHLKRIAPAVTAGPWRVLLDQLCSILQLRRRIVLRQTPRRTMPMTWGAWAGLMPFTCAHVLIPSDAASWSGARCRAVLLHELAHIKRRDCLTQLLTQLACAVYWFNPLIWYARHRMMIERERACDDLVLQHEMRASDYAEHLLEIATATHAGRFATHAAIAMARSSKLKGRLLAILDERRNRKAMTRWGAAMTVLLISAVTIPLAMLQAEKVDRDAVESQALEDDALTAEQRQRVTELLPRMHSDRHWHPVAEELIAMGPAVAEEMLPLLSRGGTDVPAIHVLKALAHESSVQQLMLEILDQPPLQMTGRYGAFLTLGASQNADHVPRILAELRRDVESEQQFAGGQIGPINALREIGGDAGLNGLIEVLDIVSPEYLWLVAEGIADVGGPDALPHLRDALMQIDLSHMSNTFNHIANAIRKLEQKLQRDPTPHHEWYALVVKAAKRRNATVADADTAVFSATVERHFQDAGPHATWVYDFDTGQKLEFRAGRRWRNIEEVEEWTREVGPDLLVAAEENGLALIGLDLALVELDRDDWDALTPEQVGELVPGQGTEEASTHRYDRETLRGKAFVFKTREGAVGMIRPLSWIDDAPGIRADVRLLQRSVEPLAMLQAERDGPHADAMDAEAKSAIVPDEVDEAHSFIAQLSSGVTVELLGLAPHPSADETWWDPSGKLLETPPNEKANVHLRSEHARVLERVLHIRGMEGDEPSITTANEVASVLSRDNDEFHWLNAFSADPERQTTDMRIGIAAGAWMTVPEAGTTGDDGTEASQSIRWRFLNGAHHPDGGYVVTVMHVDSELAYRVVAITDDGRAVIGRPGSSRVGQFMQTTAHFQDVPLEQIERIEFQTRPYAWIEFRNVSLQPGHETEVEVVANVPADAQPQPEPTQVQSTAAPPRSIIGRWRVLATNNEDHQDEHFITINEDGTFLGESAGEPTAAGSYDYDGQTLILRRVDEDDLKSPESYIGRWSGARLILSEDGKDIGFLERVSTGGSHISGPFVAKARQLIDDLMQDRVDAVSREFDTTMARSLPQLSLIIMRQQVRDAHGDLTSIGKPRAAQEEGFNVVYVPATHERGQLEWKVVFDDKNRVTGLWLAKAMPDESQSSPAKPNDDLHTRIYDISDLIRDVEQSPRQEQIDALIMLIQSSIGARDEWEAYGGDRGVIHNFHGNLIIKTHAENHREIERLLHDLQRVAQRQADDPDRDGTPRPSRDRAIGASLRTILMHTRSSIEIYRAQHNDRIPTHWRQLTEKTNAAGTTNPDDGELQFGPYLLSLPRNLFHTNSSGPEPNAPIDGHGWSYDPATGVLRAVIAPAEAHVTGLIDEPSIPDDHPDYVPRRTAVNQITTPASDNTQLHTRIYDISDLVRIFDLFEQSGEEPIAQLINLLQDQVGRPENWEKHGGSHIIRPFGDKLVVKTHDRNHDETQTILALVREPWSFQIQYESRVILLPENAERRLKEQFGGIFSDKVQGRPIARMDDLETDMLLEHARTNENVQIIDLQRMTLYNSQHSETLVHRAIQYIAGYIENDQGEHDPVTAVAVQGVNLGAAGTVNADRSAITMAIDVTVRTHATAMTAIPWPQAPEGSDLMIEDPDEQVRNVKLTVTVPDKGTLLIDTGKTITGPVLADREDSVDENLQRRIWLIVKPTIITRAELDSRSETAPDRANFKPVLAVRTTPGPALDVEQIEAKLEAVRAGMTEQQVAAALRLEEHAAIAGSDSDTERRVIYRTSDPARLLRVQYNCVTSRLSDIALVNNGRDEPSIQGRVLDGAGRPVAEARVAMAAADVPFRIQNGEFPRHSIKVRTTTTDEAGRFL